MHILHSDRARASRRRLSGVFAVGVVVFCVGLAAASPTHGQELEWATSAGSGRDDFGRGIATDPRGNGYVTGIIGGRRLEWT